jgi:hypothetical protein
MWCSGLDWITALRAPAIRALVEAGVAVRQARHCGDHLARLSGRAAHRLPQRRTRRRAPPQGLDLLAATERDLAGIAAAVARARQPLRGKDQIGLKVGAVVNRYKMARHFKLDIGQATFAFRRKTDVIAAEAALDGFYVVRTNLPKRVLGDAAMSSRPRRRLTAFTWCAPTCPNGFSAMPQPSAPIAGSRPPPPSTRNTSSPFTPGQPRSSNAPSDFSV